MIRARAIGVLASLGLAAGVAHARDAKVTAITPTTIYVDVGTADGVMVGLNLTLVLDGSSVSLRVAAAASHTARLEVVSGMRPAVGAVIPLPANLEGPRPKAPRPGPRALPPWPGAPTRALQVVQAAARHEQPAVASEEPTRVGGELALTMFLTGDGGRTSTSWQDVGVSSQLEIEAGSWRYDHLIDAHLAGSPEVLIAPLQHARARFDVYLMRLAYAPAGVRYQASLGRQPGAPLAELGLVDGGRAQLVVGPSLDVTAFAGVRPADDLGLSLSPRGGVDLGWHRAAGRGRARADLGIAVDAHAGALDRAQAAGSASVATATSFVRADGVVDLAADATGAGGARVTRASGLARTRRGRLTASAQGGYDRPFVDHALATALGDLAGLRLAPRTFGQLDVAYALRPGFELGGAGRAAWGEGVWSGYAEVVSSYTAPGWRISAAPHAVLGSLVDELGVRGSLDLPVARWSLGLGGSLDRVRAAGVAAWGGLGRISASRPIGLRWRTALSFETAAGDGPVRLFLFGMLGYRLGR